MCVLDDCMNAKAAEIFIKSYTRSLWSHLFFTFIQTMCAQGKRRVFFTFNRQNELAKERRGTKDLKLYLMSTVLHVSQCPGPVIHSSFPYLSLLRMKDKQKPNSSWLAWCFSIKALLLSRPSLHPVPTSLQPWPYIIFQTQCFSSSSLFFLFSLFPYLSKNKALLMTVGSQGPAGARVLESAARWKGGHLLLLFLLFYHRWE